MHADCSERYSARDPNLRRHGAGWESPSLQYVASRLRRAHPPDASRRAFDGPSSLMRPEEPNLYRIYMLLSRGEKEAPGTESRTCCDGVQRLECAHGGRARAARDGMYDEALQQFNRALKLNPSNAAMLYNHRARVYHYQNQLELASEELEKGLALEPSHPLLRTSVAYQRCGMAICGDRDA